MQHSTRTGAYALIVREGRILLTFTKEGPYAQLWHLPGGGVEFAEQPLQTLHRELLEEVALYAHDPIFLTVLSHHGTHPYPHHFLGLIYKVERFQSANALPQDESAWMRIDAIDFCKVTPFVQQLHELKFF